MAKKTIEKFYSDLSGTEIEENYAPLTFSFNGVSYEIDLNDAEKAKFSDAIQKYIDAARPARTNSSAKPSSTSKHDAKVVRAWAISNSLDVPARGRIPAHIVAAYEASEQ